MNYSEILSVVPNMSETQLNTLIKFSTEELKRKEARAAWIEKMCDMYISHPNAESHIRESLTIVAVYNHYCGTRIGTAFPVNGDTYNAETGIAVAFAKAIGEPVPDFI